MLEHAINEGLSGFYAEAVRENKLRPLGQPEVEVTKVPGLTAAPAGEEGELHFTAEVEVRPEITVPALDGIAVTVDDVEVTDEDVAARLDALRERFGTLVGVDRPAAEGDFVVIDLTATIGDEQVDTVSGVSYQIGSGNMLEGLDEALTGLSAGETTTFETALAGGDHAGETAQVTVTATTVKERQLPDADDDFAQLASEFDTLEELTADLRTQASSIKTSNQAVQARDLLLEQLLAAHRDPRPGGRRRGRGAPSPRGRGPARGRRAPRRGRRAGHHRAAQPDPPRHARRAARDQGQPERAARVPGERVAPVRHGPEHVHPDHRPAGPDPDDGRRGRALQGARRRAAPRRRHRRLRQRRRPVASSSARTPRTPPRPRRPPGAAAAPSDAATDIAAFDVYDDEVETAEDTKA